MRDSGRQLAAVAALIGCQWGHRISLANDRARCQRQAVQRVALHGGRDGTILVRLCAVHRDVVCAHTDPHGEVDDAHP